MEPEKSSQTRQQTKLLDRRLFLGTSAPFLLDAATVRGSQANSRITLGMIGCGGRGTWIADLFQKHGGYQLVAAADYFPERLGPFSEKFQVPKDRLHSGLSGYQQLVAGKVDAVAIESPPYFHPTQAEAAVAAGKHVFLAKPVSVDLDGCQRVLQAGKNATEKKLCFRVDFQTRMDPMYQEAVKRSQVGDIGRIVCGEATYSCGPTWDRQAEFLLADPGNPEARLRAWGLDQILSGDVITEQNIHALDVACWILDAEPVSATGTGGRKARKAGTCWDHFSVIYRFPGDLLVTFCSKQLGQGWDDICCRMYGTDGTVDTHYFGEVSIRGKMPYKGGRMENLFQRGAAENIAAFHQDVLQGQCANSTVAPSVRSNRTTILGRQAAYRHSTVTWEEMMSRGETFDPRLEGLKA